MPLAIAKVRNPVKNKRRTCTPLNPGIPLIMAVPVPALSTRNHLPHPEEVAEATVSKEAFVRSGSSFETQPHGCSSG
jgi:hypothetical protein